MAEIKYTPEQSKIIESRDKNLLVSASAGSGKTTVMIRRILELIQKDKVPLENFLIVTFTKASAADMKKKLERELSAAEQTDYILEQIDSVATADISNLHSFCSKLISMYFYKLQIDPIFHVVEENEQLLLKERAAKLLFEEKEREFDENFFHLFEIFQKKRGIKGLKEAIFKINEFSNSILGGTELLKKKVVNSHQKDLSKNTCASIINSIVCKEISEDALACDEFAERALSFGLQTFYDHFVDVSSKLRSVKSTNSYLVNAKNLNEISYPRTPSVKQEELKFLAAEAKTLKERIKNNRESYKKNYISDDLTVLEDGIEASKNDLLSLITLTQEFDEKYKKLKREANVLDFNDLEKYALEILEDDAILEAVKAKYKYIFVDEYQDINEVQEKLITLLSGTNNRFMVGDIKQSIYRFRFCDPDIFLNKYKTYMAEGEISEVINLNCNFRSDRNILKFVDKVFSGVMTEDFGGIDYAKSSKFTAGEKSSDDKTSVTLCYINSTSGDDEKVQAKGIYSVKEHVQEPLEEEKVSMAEANYVAAKIEEIVNENEDINYSDIVILTPSRNATSGVFTDTLKSYNIPISSDDKQDLTELKFVDEIVSFCKLCVNAYDDITIFKVLKSSLFNFSDDELIKIRLSDESKRFYSLVLDPKNIDDMVLANKLNDFNEKLTKFSELAKELLVGDFVKLIANEFELEWMLLASENGETKRSQLSKFISGLAKLSVFEFVNDYDNYSSMLEADSGANAVKIMSIHRSKGMEFKVVFVVGTSEKVNFRSTYGNLLISKTFGAGMSHFNSLTRVKSRSVVQSAIGMLEKRKLVEEYQRLLYVALTRAINKMYIVCSCPKEELSEKFSNRPNKFCDWFNPIIYSNLNGEKSDDYVFESHTLVGLSDSGNPEKPQLLLREELDAKYKPFEYGFMEESRVPLKNSVSKLIESNFEPEAEFDFDDDFEKFEETENEVFYKSFAERGTAYHKVLQYLDLKSRENIDENIEKIISEKLNAEQQKLVDKFIIKKILNMPFFAEINAEDIVLTEREFLAKMPAKLKINSAKNSDTFTLQGVIDLIVIRNNKLILLDYKTGKITDDKLDKYKFQLDLYADVASRAFEMEISKKYLLFIDEQKIIEI